MRERGWTRLYMHTPSLITRASGKARRLLADQFGRRILSIKTPAYTANPSFFDRWLVPISAAIVAAIGLAYLLLFKPKATVRGDARAGSMDEEVVEVKPVPAH